MENSTTNLFVVTLTTIEAIHQVNQAQTQDPMEEDQITDHTIKMEDSTGEICLVFAMDLTEDRITETVTQETTASSET
jgi:hypothetical protein